MEPDAINNLISKNTIPDVPNTSKVVADRPSICPYCGSNVKAYFIHFNNKIVMCEDVTCLYPFNDDPIYEKVDPNLPSDEELECYNVSPSRPSQGTGSIVSTTEWSEINRLCGDINRYSTKRHTQEEMEMREQTRKVEENIRQNVEQIKVLNKKLFEEKEGDSSIENEALMESIYRVQDKTGLKLLKDDELKKLKKEGVNKSDELMFDIASNHESIKIQVRNQNKSEPQ